MRCGYTSSILLGQLICKFNHNHQSYLLHNRLLRLFCHFLNSGSIAKRMTSTGDDGGPGKMKFIDIGANLTDEMYSGLYNGSRKHDPDLETVLSRAWDVGLEKIIITAGNLEDVQNSAKLAETNERLYATVGVHPTRCSEFDSKFSSPVEYIQNLQQEFDSHSRKIVALGEFGLDYERTKFCDKDTQKKYFRLQLEQLGPVLDLPLFLHCRGAASDMVEVMSENKTCFPKGGVVHSFDGSIEEMKQFLELGLHIGINGCSLKTEENCAVVKEIPLERLLLETDAPWCGIRPSHFSAKFVKTKFAAAKKTYDQSMMYKTRNEPHTILNVLEVIANLKEMEDAELARIVFENTERLFFS